MRVLFINAFFGRGSTGRLVETLFYSLRKKGVETFAIAGFDNPKLDNVISLKKFPSDLDLYLAMLRTRITGFNGFEKNKNTKKICNYILKIKPDIINIHVAHGGYINILSLLRFLKSQNTKVVFTMHDCWLMTGHCPHFSIFKCDKWKERCGHCQHLKECIYPRTYLFDRSEKQFLFKKEAFENLACNFIAPCNWIRDFIPYSPILKNYFLSKTIYNGIDFYKVESKECFKFKELLNEEKKILLFVSSQLTQSKGINEIEELSKIISDEYLIVLVGKRKKVLDKTNEKIRYIGSVDNQAELKFVYENSYAFINMTLADTFPTTLIEALQSGTRVITYKTGGCAEIKKDGFAFVPETNTPIAFYKEIKRINHSFEYDRDSIIEYGKTFSSEKMVNNYYDFFVDILEGGTKK